jgi:hypothetical protein
MKKYLLVLFLSLTQFIISQNSGEKLIKGTIVVDKGNAEAVTIVNLVNEKSTISDNQGNFRIWAKAEDLLVFSSVNLEYHRLVLEEADLKSENLIIKMTSKVTSLEEVIVNKHPEINAVALGISPKGIIKRSPAERKLATASSLSLNPMGLDPLLNAISGRTKMLKKELEIEKKERLLLLLEALYNDSNYFQEVLQIPKEYTKAFQFYCIENMEFREVLKTKNKTKIEFSIVPLAEKFNKILFEKK